MTVQILKNFLTKEYCNELIENYSCYLSPVEERPGYFEDFNDLKLPISIEDYYGVKTDAPNKAYGEALISNAALLTKKELQKFYSTNLLGYEGGMVRLTKGAKNGLHSDMYNLDGTNWEDGSGRQDELEFSALLYLSTHNKDFTGGTVFFPKQNLKIKPEAGMLVFFRGDLEHIHEVEEILSGDRHAIIMFFGKTDRQHH